MRSQIEFANDYLRGNFPTGFVWLSSLWNLTLLLCGVSGRDVSLPLVSNGCGPQHPMSRCNFIESDNMKNMDGAQCEPNHAPDRHEQILCFWWIFLLLTLSGNSVNASRQPTEAWQTDGAGVRAIVDSQKLDLCEKLTESEWVLEWKHKSILSACQNAKGESAWETQRTRDRERRGRRERESERGQAPSKPL